uniref:Uncharacterized protein n=1 Tax=Anas zonorhyncha TaxID=75864 RepID=A0A8B9VRQ9_9AVES
MSLKQGLNTRRHCSGGQTFTIEPTPLLLRQPGVPWLPGTPAHHSTLQPRTPGHKQSSRLSLPCSWGYRCAPLYCKIFSWKCADLQQAGLEVVEASKYFADKMKTLQFSSLFCEVLAAACNHAE